MGVLIYMSCYQGHTFGNEEFLYWLRRLIAVRVTSIEIWSDDASQFKTASDVLHSLWNQTIKCDQIQSYISNSGIKWSIIVELAPLIGWFATNG